MEIKINPYLSVTHIVNSKGKFFDNKKNFRLKGKIVDIKEADNSTTLFIELLQKESDLANCIGEIVSISSI
jgi:hypothetical protein